MLGDQYLFFLRSCFPLSVAIFFAGTFYQNKFEQKQKRISTAIGAIGFQYQFRFVNQKNIKPVGIDNFREKENISI